MHVVILGAGTVGSSIAESLCREHLDVSLVDDSRDALSAVEEGLDVQTVHGSATSAVALFQAGVLSADLCLAVTSRDEINLVGASLAKAMGARRSVARVLDQSYRDVSTFDYRRHFGIDRLLSLEHLTALELAKEIRAPGLFAVENFARGGVQVQEVAVDENAKACGRKLRDLHLPSQVRIGLIDDGQRTIIPMADDTIHAADRVTLIGTGDAIDDIKGHFQKRTQSRQDIIIAGGGEIGFHLARALQRDDFNVVVIEENAERCEYLAKHLIKATVLNADTTRRDQLEEARVGQADVFVAAMGRDEDNIICGVEARELGAERILSVVRRPDYGNVLSKIGIDVAVSPRKVMAREVFGLAMGGQVLGRSDVSGGNAAILEVEVGENAPITTAPLKDQDLTGCLIAALVRETYVRVAGGDDQLQSGDIAVLLVQDGRIDEAIRMFEPAR